MLENRITEIKVNAIINDSTKVDAAKIWRILASVADPEVPVLTVIDLGIVRDVQMNDALKSWDIVITPTYSGCPAMDMIAMNIRLALMEHEIKNFNIVQQLSPAWTTDWMSEAGKQKLLQYGIAPPVGKAMDEQHLEDLQLTCPQCKSTNTQLVSQFGSTSCKALFKCLDCLEPFDYFKCH
jgi:ring-1,2-phenylacetyl-CoA epoxidase subunit PaaD